MEPVTRIEQFLSAIIENDVTPPSAVTRIEQYLKDIYNGTTSTLTPVTRVETYLAKISGADVDIPTPVTRLEIYLAAIAGEDVDTPTPVSHLEYFLAELANGVLETVTGNAPLTLANAVARGIKSLTQTGRCTQASTPTPSAPVAIKCNNGEIKWDSVNHKIYIDGTDEVITVTDANGNTQTAHVASLFSRSSTGGTADNQDIISGTVTHNIGIKALDGTEGWVASSGVLFAVINGMKKTNSNTGTFSTHYIGTTATNSNMPNNSVKMIKGNDENYGTLVIKDTAQSTADDFEAYLASQYAEGTPVIIVYMLATPITEKVAAQPLTTAVGTNTVSVTAEVSPIALSCEYYKQSS